jgi:predicted Zn-dependent protease
MLEWIRMKSFRALMLTIPALGLAFAGCATNPVTGHKQISFVSSGKELAMGRQSDPAILAEYGLYDNPALQKYVESVGMRVAKVSHLPDLEWHFRLLDSPVVNAFAVPGGYIYITRGIVSYLNNEAQLAGVIGHECGHVTARHTAQDMTQQEIAQVGLLAGMVFSPAVREYGVVASQGLGLLFLKYSRDHETQADELGVGYATKAGYDPREIPGTYQMLKRYGDRQGESLPNFLSTHPDPGDRELRTKQLAEASISRNAHPNIGAAEYRAAIEGMVYGNDPRAGFFENSRFYHPDLAFQMIFPTGWTTQNTPSAVLASSQSMGAAIQVTLGNSTDKNLLPSEYVDSLRIRHSISGSTGHAEQFRDFPAWVGSIQMQGGEAPAGFIRIHPGQFLEVVGQTKNGVGDDMVYAAIRSVAALRDSSKLNVTANHIVYKNAPRTATFATIWSDLGPEGVDVEEGAILNNMRATEEVQAGTPIKTVQKGKSN